MLSREYEQACQTHKFETLKPYLTGDAASLSLSDAGARLGVSAAAAKLAQSTRQGIVPTDGRCTSHGHFDGHLAELAANRTR